MTRSWTDPRTGTRWRIQAVSSPTRRGPRAANEDSAREPPALVFQSDDDSYALPAWEAAQLETLGEEQLVELLDNAKGKEGPAAEPRGRGRKGPRSSPDKQGGR